MKRVGLLVGAVVLVVAVVLGLDLRRRGVAGPPGPFPSAPVVFVSIDTLRADRLPAYGYAGGSTPRLDALARESVLFEDVYSHVPLTLPAHASMFTGLLPPNHGVRDNAGFVLGPGAETLASRFRRAGAETGGAVSAYVLRRATGIAQGFDWYDDAVEMDASLESLGDQQRDGAIAVDRLAAWIEGRGGRRFFAFLHLYEPHTPWDPPPAFRDGRTPYDGEVSYADELVGRFLDRLRAAGVLDGAVVVVTSDHGEGLGDHGEREHGLFLYREAVRVPLLVRLPGGARGGARVSGVAAQVDLAATVLDLAGLAHDGLDGVSLRPAIASGRVGERPVYSETLFPRYHFGWSELLAVTDGRLRYIHAPRPELFDVGADPGERRNLAGEREAAVRSMAAWAQAQAGAGGPPAPAEVPADVRERLEALGYVGGESAPPSSATGPLADPKDRVAAFEAFKAAASLRMEGRLAEAVPALEAVLAADPGMLEARETLGTTLFRLGRDREAVRALEAVLAADPERASAHLTLSRLHAAAGRHEDAARHAAQATARMPGEAYEVLAQVSLEAGKLDEAAAFARHAVEADPRRAVARLVLALALRRQGRCEEALAALDAAEAAQAQQKAFVMPGLHAARGDCLARLGREADAERAFQAEVTAIPHSTEGRVGLAILYRSQGRDADARAVLEGLIASHPRPGPNEYWAVVRTLRGLGDSEAASRWLAEARRRFPSDPRFR